MKHSKKILALAMSIAVVASIAAAGTLAYLTGQDSVINNFNVGTKGQVEITLDEAPVDENGKKEEGDRVDFNQYENMIPGQVLDKDPTVHVQANSAASYVFVAVKNDLGENGALDINTNAWQAISSGYANTIIYKYVGSEAENGVVSATEKVVDLEPVFNTVTINKELDAEGLAKLNDKQIIVLAYAIQAENLATETVSADQIATQEAVTYFSQAVRALGSSDYETGF